VSDGIGYTPEDDSLPIKLIPVWNAGRRATYEPPKEDGYRVRAKIIYDKVARRVLRKRAFGAARSRIVHKLDKLAVLKAQTRRECSNSHEAARVFAAELADRRAKRAAARDGVML
jgi:hypothetical protein